MSSRLQQLLFRLRLIDEASGPAGKIAKRFDDLTNRASAGVAKIGVGAAGVWGTVEALKGLIGPSIEMDRALGEVRSLDVQDDALGHLRNTALKTSIMLGDSASEIARSAYDIQSAIAGLSGADLSKFTQASAILAKGTKSDASTITAYMGTMYGIFQNTANQMGKGRWVEMLTGQTATAVKMFKTTGSNMSAAFTSIGAEATSAGIGMTEQMAILGQLQATMSGSEAGTKYKAFLAGVGNAQKALGLEFTDSQGRLLPMVNILEQIRGKFGDTFDVAESDALKKAFGSQEATALIKLLMQDLDGLQSNIGTLGKVKGMDQAVQMAQAIADPWERVAAVGTALKTVIGAALSPVLIPLAEKLIDIGAVLQEWAVRFPNITRLIGIATLVVFGLVGAFSAFAVIGGVAQLAMIGFAPVLAIARTGMLLFNAALWANPITWVVVAVIALIAALGALVYYWDDVKVVAVDFVQSMMDRFENFKKYLGLLNPFALLGHSIDWLIDKLNLIPGVNIDTTSRFSNPAMNPAESGVLGPEARGTTLDRASIVPPGGLQQDFNNNGRSTVVEKMEIHTTQPVDGFLVADQLAMA